MSETDALIQALQDGRTIYYVAVASLTLLVFDHVLTLEEEVQHLWKSKWNPSKILYLWQRYFALVSLSGLTAARVHGFCGSGVFSQIDGVVMTITTGTVDFVLAVRVWALYARDKRVLWFLMSMTLLEVVAMLTLGEVATKGGVQGDFVVHAPSTTICATPKIPLTILSYFPLIPLITASIMFLMTMFKCVRSLWDFRREHMPILSLFLRDGVFWFLAVLCITLAAFLNWRLGRASLVTVMDSPIIVVYTIVSSRTLLNLKEVLAVHDSASQPSQLEVASRLVFTPADSWTEPPPQHCDSTQDRPRSVDGMAQRSWDAPAS